PSGALLGGIGGWARLNFSTIMVLPLFRRTDQAQVGHARALREAQQVFHRRERRFRPAVRDPSISADAPYPGVVVVFRKGSYRGMQVRVVGAHVHSSNGSIRSHGWSLLASSSTPASGASFEAEAPAWVSTRPP